MVQHLLREANLDFVSAIREVIHVAVLAREVAAAVARRNTGRETLTNDKKKVLYKFLEIKSYMLRGQDPLSIYV